MTLVLNIALLVIGTMATLAAFGGETWHEGQEPIQERITARGWISLLFLLLALAIGLVKEVRTHGEDKKKDMSAAADKAAASRMQREISDTAKRTEALQELNTSLQERLVKSSDVIASLARENLYQVTGGDGFPVAIIVTQAPDNGGFPLRASVNGKATLNDVSFSVTEGAYTRPNAEELKKMLNEGLQELNGHGSVAPIRLGSLNPGYIVPMGYTIHPKSTEINTYRIEFNAKNGGVLEKLEVRFSAALDIWQYRYEVKSDRAKDPNKIIAKGRLGSQKSDAYALWRRPPILVCLRSLYQ